MMNEHVLDFYLYMLEKNEFSNPELAKQYLLRAWNERKNTL